METIWSFHNGAGVAYVSPLSPRCWIVGSWIVVADWARAGSVPDEDGGLGGADRMCFKAWH